MEQEIDITHLTVIENPSVYYMVVLVYAVWNGSDFDEDLLWSWGAPGFSSTVDIDTDIWKASFFSFYKHTIFIR